MTLLTLTDAPEICDYRSHKANADEESVGRFCRGTRDRGVRLILGGVWFVSTVH